MLGPREWISESPLRLHFGCLLGTLGTALGASQVMFVLEALLEIGCASIDCTSQLLG